MVPLSSSMRASIDTTAEVIELLKTEIPAQIHSIGLLIASNDRDNLKKQLHKLKGAALTGCLNSIASIAAEMEQMINNDVDASLLQDKLSELGKEWHYAETEMNTQCYL